MPHSAHDDDDDDDDDSSSGDPSITTLGKTQLAIQKQPPRFQSLAGIAGNILEWYDFAVFGFFADIIGDLFFPPQDGQKQLMESFAIFGGAFLMRPIGGIIMGWIGDTHGRKKALEISIFLMAFPTFAMGCLPTYEQVGPLATVLLILVRLLQGLSVGGQLMSSLVFTLEHEDKSKWGLAGSYVLASANFGTLIGGLTGAFFRAVCSDEQLRSFGWRIPFLAGIVVSLCGIYLKYACEDDFHTTVDTPKNPVRKALQSGRHLAAACLVPMLWSAGFYLTFVWLAIYMNDLVTPPVPFAFWVNSCSLFVSVCLLFPVAGAMSDRYGRERIMTIGGCSFAFLAPFALFLINVGNPFLAFVLQSMLGISLSLWGAPLMAWLVESFPPEARLTSVAIGYNIAQATMGGVTPSIATIMADAWTVAPGFLLTIIALVSLFGLKCVAPAGKEAIPQDDEDDVSQVVEVTTRVSDKELV